jgi:hypothetical protein
MLNIYDFFSISIFPPTAIWRVAGAHHPQSRGWLYDGGNIDAGERDMKMNTKTQKRVRER